MKEYTKHGNHIAGYYTEAFNMPHTKGPLTIDRDMAGRELPNMLRGKSGEVVAHLTGRAQYRRGDACLLAAAYTSYDKHCGDRAVECAEGDMLGAALRLLEGMNHMGGDERGGYCICPCQDGSATDSEHATTCAEARAILAKVKGAA